MIRYSLHCDNGHQFEAWFAGSDAFEQQHSEGQVVCPACGSSDIGKMLMTPSVSTSRSKARQAQGEEQVLPVVSSPAVPQSLPEEIRTMMRKVRDHVTENADYVGKQFAEEARKIHYGERDERGIYGEASFDEVKTLHEEGIDIMPLPVLPEDSN